MTILLIDEIEMYEIQRMKLNSPHRRSPPEAYPFPQNGVPFLFSRDLTVKALKRKQNSSLVLYESPVIYQLTSHTP